MLNGAVAQWMSNDLLSRAMRVRLPPAPFIDFITRVWFNCFVSLCSSMEEHSLCKRKVIGSSPIAGY